MPTLVTDVDDTLIHVGGDPDGKEREHVVTAVKLLLKAGWIVKVWSREGAAHAAAVVKQLGLKIDKAQCFTKPAHPYTSAKVRPTAEMYERNGRTLVGSFKVDVQNTLSVDLSERGNDVRVGDFERNAEVFRGEALVAAGVYDPYTATSAQATTDALKAAGYDSVRITSPDYGIGHSAVGGNQLIVFDPSNNVVMIGAPEEPHSGFDTSGEWSRDSGAYDVAFAKTAKQSS